MNGPANVRDDSLDVLVAQIADEYLELLERGERPDPDVIAARYPPHRAAIRQVLASLDLVRLDTSQPIAGQPCGAPRSQLGEFELLEEIGRGGMGVVYRARQRSLGRLVAVKVLPLAAALDQRQLQRFQNEAQAAALLQHPHIVPVYAVGCEGGVHFFVMQLIEGRSLAAVVAELRDRARREEVPHRPRPAGTEAVTVVGLSTDLDWSSNHFVRSAVHLIRQVASALDHAHQLGIVHRDIKPGNILIAADGAPWITDFGLARLQGDAGLTMTGDLVGTVRYMSPEQARGWHAAVDHRSDIYALGLTLYELLTLEPAFAGSDRERLLQRIVNEEPLPPRRLNPAIPPDLQTIVLKAIAKEAADRYATAGELAADFSRFLDDQPILARRPTPRQQAARWLRKHARTVVAALGMLILLLLVGVAMLAAGNRRVRHEQQQTERALRQETEAKLTLAEALEKLGTEQRRANAALEDQRRTGYGYQVVLADREWRMNHLAAARRILRQCPETLRDWEWHYLLRRCQQDGFSLPAESRAQLVAWAPNGRQLLVCGQRLEVWDVVDRQRVCELQASFGKVLSATFSPDGARIAICGGPPTGLFLFDPASGLPDGELPAIPGAWRQAAYSSDGNLLAAAGMGLELVRLATGERLPLDGAPTGRFLAVALSPDLQWLAAHHSDTKTVWVWNLSDGQVRRKYRIQAESLKLVFGTGNQLLILASDATLRMVDVGGSAAPRSFRPATNEVGDQFKLALSPDNRLLAVAGGEHSIAVTDLVRNGRPNTIRGLETDVLDLQFSPDNSQLAVASRDGKVQVWDASADQSYTPVAFSDGLGCLGLAATSDGSFVLIEGSRGVPIRISRLNPADGKVAELIRPAPLGRAFAAHGDWLACLAGLGQTDVLIADTQGQTIARFANPRGPAGALALHQQRERLALWWNTRGVALIDLATHQVQYESERIPGMVYGLAFSPDGGKLAIAYGRTDGGGLQVLDVESGRRELDLSFPAMAHSVAFAPGGRELAVGLRDGTLQLRELPGGALRRQLTGHSAGVYALAYNQSGTRLFSGGFDRKVRVWELVQGRELLTLEAPGDGIRWLALDSSQRFLAVVHQDGSAEVFDGTPLAEIPVTPPAASAVVD
ncbi:MAG: protein kinase [Pirellulaceae bacterium]|nr:protein kinase [Pirellulaceae bacterium]